MMSNLFSDIPGGTDREQFDALLNRPGLRIERIVSHGHATAPGSWYDEPHHEWVLVLQGSAALRFEDESAPRILKSGDFIDIAAHRRHRVESTAPDAPTIWLAVHYAAEGGVE